MPKKREAKSAGPVAPAWQTSDGDLLRRAMAAYYRSGGGDGGRKFTGSAVEEHDGRRYVVLRDSSELLRVYRVREHDGVLKGLRRWPKSISVAPGRQGERHA